MTPRSAIACKRPQGREGAERSRPRGSRAGDLRGPAGSFHARYWQAHDRQTRHFDQTGLLARTGAPDSSAHAPARSGPGYVFVNARTKARERSAGLERRSADRSRSSEIRQKSTWTPSTVTTGIESPYALQVSGVERDVALVVTPRRSSAATLLDDRPRGVAQVAARPAVRAPLERASGIRHPAHSKVRPGDVLQVKLPLCGIGRSRADRCRWARPIHQAGNRRFKRFVQGSAVTGRTAHCADSPEFAVLTRLGRSSVAGRHRARRSSVAFGVARAPPALPATSLSATNSARAYAGLARARS